MNLGATIQPEIVLKPPCPVRGLWLAPGPTVHTIFEKDLMGWWCSGILSGLLRRRSGVLIPDPPTLEKCAKGICLCNLLRSTQPNDRETVIEG